MRQILVILSIIFSFTVYSCTEVEEKSTAVTTTSDTTAPTVLTNYPSDSLSSVAPNTSLTVTFSEAMDTTTVMTNISDTTCSGSLQVSLDSFSTCVQMSTYPIATDSNKTFNIDPASNLSYNTTYKIKVTTAAKDSAGNALASAYTHSTGFTTSSTLDKIAPTVSSSSPADSDSSVAPNISLTVSFSEAMDTTTITTNSSDTTCSGSLQVSSDSFTTCVQMSSSPTISNSNKTFTTTPISDLSVNTTYMIRVTTGVKDSAGNTLSSQYETSSGFTTYGVFVVVGKIGTILTSPDGTTWTSRTSGITNILNDTTYGNNIFVTVGGNGAILTSSDNGTTWIYRTSGTTNTLQGVTYANSTFVTVGVSGTILTSPDGVSWDQRTSGASEDLWEVSYGSSTFVTVGGTGTILTSSDGITWTSRTTNSSTTFLGITYGNNKFVAVGEGIYTSSDGITWTKRTSQNSWTDAGYAVTFGNDIFVLGGMSGLIKTSTDGITWTSSNSGATINHDGFTFGRMFILVGSGGSIFTSFNGTNWTSKTSGTSNDLFGATNLK